MISHSKVLQLIGEIDDIRLKTGDDGEHSVYITIGGEQIEVIRDYASHIDHIVTRNGIANCIHNGGI